MTNVLFIIRKNTKKKIFNIFMNSNKFIGVYFYKSCPESDELIKTIKIMTPVLYDQILFQDLTSKNYNYYPEIVKRIGKLPILVSKGNNDPLVGVLPIKKWIANFSYQKNDSNDKQLLTNNEKAPLIFNKDNSFNAFIASEMGRATSYSYINDEYPEDNYERLNTIKGNTIDTNNYMSMSNESDKSSKNGVVSKRYEEMMNERKKLLESQNGALSI